MLINRVVVNASPLILITWGTLVQMQLNVEQGTEEDLYWAPGSHLHMSLIYGEGVSP